MRNTRTAKSKSNNKNKTQLIKKVTTSRKLKLLILILTIITLILAIIRNFDYCSASGDIPNGRFQIDIHATPNQAKPPAEESKFWLELLELWRQIIGSSP